MIGVLFVCTGNICRSPTAEGIFRRAVADAGLDGQFRIDSAGISSYHIGEGPDPRSIETAARRGVDLSSIRARPFTPDDYAAFDYILAMDNGHLQALTTRIPEGTTGSIRLFIPATDVPDPWYGGTQDFETVFDMVADGAVKLLDDIRKEKGI